VPAIFWSAYFARGLARHVDTVDGRSWLFREADKTGSDMRKQIGQFSLETLKEWENDFDSRESFSDMPSLVLKDLTQSESRERAERACQALCERV
jgi:hypothetical protein